MKFDHLIKVVIVCVLFSSLTSYVQAEEICGQWDSRDVMGGEYRIHNNVWGGDPGTQCINVYPDSTYFPVTVSTHSSGDVQAYPFILKGVHFGGTNTVDSGLPIQVGNVVTAPFIWSVDPNGATGKWNISFESWFSSTGGIAPDKAELMIWINYKDMYCGGSKVASNVLIGGHRWDVYHASPWGSWEHYIAYRIITPVNYVNLDLKDFINDSLSRGYLQNSWYLDNMEAGFELMTGGQGLTSKSFAALVNDVFSTDFTDFAVFADQWLRSDCEGPTGWCDGADYAPEDGVVDYYDLEDFVGYWLEE
ncbi:MAG: glycoside hydrolase [Phycisphaerae bacterium]|jgi:hypothetical protein